jgi:hypothetical protein
VQQVRTYDENEGKVYSKPRPPEDEEGSIANLVPGGRVSQRSSRGGAAVAEARRERNKPLKINADLRLVRPSSMLRMLAVAPFRTEVSMSSTSTLA